MSTISENLQALKDSKESIAEAIISKGGVVGESDGLSSFASLISALTIGGKKVQYITEIFQTENSRRNLTYELDFNPQAVFIVCNENESVIDPIILADSTITATNRLSVYCYFCCRYGFGEDMANDMFAGLYHDTASEGLVSKTSNIFQTPTQVGNKWSVTLGRTSDTSTNAYRFVQSGDVTKPLQILFIGE